MSIDTEFDDELAGDELEGFDPLFNADEWLRDLDEVVADFIEDVVGGDYE